MIGTECCKCNRDLNVETNAINTNTNSPSYHNQHDNCYDYIHDNGIISLICEECYIIKQVEDRDKKLKSLTKKWWQFWI